MKLASHDKCTGCMACMQACKHHCISSYEDAFGNVYPVIDRAKCLDCGICSKKCPVLQDISAKYPQNAYAVWSLNQTDRDSSASGGAATVFYNKAIKMGYSIVGVEFQDGYKVNHVLTSENTYVSRFKQSKYVYSSSETIFSEVKKELKQKNVLFISLPCKVAGLLSYLGDYPDNLLTVDIVCHGCPSQKLLQEHIKCVDNLSRGVKLCFRKDNLFLFELSDIENKSFYKKIGKTDSYVAAFLEGLDYRESCYICPYAKNERISDITICDFWGLGKTIPFNHPYSGSISCVLVNTEKGRLFFNQLNGLIFQEERPVEEAIDGNAQLNYPTHIHPLRSQFEQLYQDVGFDESVRIVLKSAMSKEKMNQCISQIKQPIRRIVKTILGRR